jgi:DNA topoisomerase-2
MSAPNTVKLNKINPQIKAKPGDLSIEERYQKKSLHEHILALPDTYTGGISKINKDMYVYDEATNKIIKKTMIFIAGLYKIYDEILVNARDHSIRDKTCKNIKITIDVEKNRISVWNDGNGVPVEIHKEHKVYVPELIFGNLLTSENYENKNKEKKIVGGKNGYGAKLTNIFSSEFELETADGKSRKRYLQKFSSNMYKIEKPIITDMTDKEKPFTRISFVPDFKIFGIDKLSDEMIELYKKRAFDLAACTDVSTKVYLNDKLIKFESFNDYVQMYYDELPSEIVSLELPRWKVYALFDPTVGHVNISFVNGVYTPDGGSHVAHVSEQIVSEVTKLIKNKKGNTNLNVKGSHIRDNLTLFIDSVIENPAFSSQAKENLTTKMSEFGSRCDVTSGFIQKLSKTGLIEEVIKFAQFKEQSGLKKTDGKKVQNLRGLTKLDDAKWAGSRKSKQCRLILTEGDSAKTFATSGLDIIGREKYGVFPLKGKLLNVRDASMKQLENNDEIRNIKQILGLKQNKKYDDIGKLRYGGIIILTDQDVDGSHIKGLLINFFHYFWPSLAKTKGFIQSMVTPILKVFKKTDTKKLKPIIFYTIAEYKKWAETHDTAAYEVKYYKGLGTSTEKEAKEAFNDFENHLITYVWDVHESNKPDTQDLSNPNSNTNLNEDIDIVDSDDNIVEPLTDNDPIEIEDDIEDDDVENDKKSDSYNHITLAFSKIRANDRKKWLKEYDPNISLDRNLRNITYSEFVNKELIHFSNYDNIRSLPSLCDGLKPSLRKILYACIKKRIFKNEIKVAQLAAYVAENTEYHHGEMSLQGAIIGMGQNYVGSNNINLLTPNGNFGTRRMGGKDASSARYIFTQLNDLIPKLFRAEDELIYTYVEEDNFSVEPTFYVPIIPMILVNEIIGIGTGYSTYIPCYNPKDIIANLYKLLDNKKQIPMTPWYRGFKGQIKPYDDTSYIMHGSYEIINQNTIRITELPAGLWTQDYIEFLEDSLIDEKAKEDKKEKFIQSYDKNCGNNTVDFTIKFSMHVLQDMIKTDTLTKRMKLFSYINTTNMYMYNESGVIHKYTSAEDILSAFYTVRLGIYNKRKQHYIRVLEHKLKMLKYRRLFIQKVCDNEILVAKRSKDSIIQQLEDFKFPKMAHDVDAPEDKTSYSYIIDLPLFALTTDRMMEYDEEMAVKTKELNTYKLTTLESMWKSELLELETAYSKFLLDNPIDADEPKIKKNKAKAAISLEKSKATAVTKVVSASKTPTKVARA